MSEEQDITGLFSRQSTIQGLRIPESVAVIGVGGVGSWTALFFALVGVKRVVMVDFDVVEEHNLNRTIFRQEDIGANKADALVAMISERRPDCLPLAIKKRVEGMTREEVAFVRECEYIIDGRDTTAPLVFPSEKSPIKGGYNGTSVTMHLNESNEAVWGRTGGQVTYSTIPSYLVPPVFIAMWTIFYCTTPAVQDKEEKIRTADMSAFFKEMFQK